MASFSKGKTGGNQPIGFRTPDFLKQSRFGRPTSGRGFRVKAPNVKQVRITQHKGGS